ncbi:hypothetical protein Tco_0064902 [Tanacetum coccineum]
MPRRKWSNLDKRRSGIMVDLIDKQMLERRILRNLERLVGARELEMDYRLMQRTRQLVQTSQIHSHMLISTNCKYNGKLRSNMFQKTYTTLISTSSLKPVKNITKAKVKKEKDPGAPKQPPTAFFIFMDEFRKDFKEKFPDNKSAAIVAKEGGAKWKAMFDSEKAPYEEKAASKKSSSEVHDDVEEVQVLGSSSLKSGLLWENFGPVAEAQRISREGSEIKSSPSLISATPVNNIEQRPSNILALVQLTLKNGIPFFELVVKSRSDILVAEIIKIPSEDDSSLIYAFYSVYESKKTSSDVGYDTVGEMKISSAYVAAEKDLYVVRESVLYSTSDTVDCKLNGKLAAIIVKNPSDKTCGDIGSSKSTVVILPEGTSSPSMLCATLDRLDLCYQVGPKNKCSCRLVSLEDGSHSLEYDPSMSLLQAFSIAMAVLTSHKLTSLFRGRPTAMVGGAWEPP